MSLLPHGSATFSRGPRPYLSCCPLPSSLAASAAHAQLSFCPADFPAVSVALYLLFTAPSLQAFLCRGVYSESPRVSLSHSSLAYAWTPLSQKTPLPALLSTRAPRGGGGGLLALQGPQKLSWSWGCPSCLASPSCTFSPSLFLAPLPTCSRSTSPPWFSLQTESYTGTHTHPALKTGSQSRLKGKGDHQGGMERPDIEGDQDKEKRRGRRRWSPRARKRREGNSETSRGHGAAGAGRCPGGGRRSRQHLGSDAVARLLPPRPHWFPRCAIRVRCVPSAPGAPRLLDGRHSSFCLPWDCQGCQALIGP